MYRGTKFRSSKSVHTCDSTDFSFSLVYLFAQISRPPDFDFFIVPVASRFSELNAWTKTQLRRYRYVLNSCTY